MPSCSRLDRITKLACDSQRFDKGETHSALTDEQLASLAELGLHSQISEARSCHSTCINYGWIMILLITLLCGKFNLFLCSPMSTTGSCKPFLVIFTFRGINNFLPSSKFRKQNPKPSHSICYSCELVISRLGYFKKLYVLGIAQDNIYLVIRKWRLNPLKQRYKQCSPSSSHSYPPKEPQLGSWQSWCTEGNFVPGFLLCSTDAVSPAWRAFIMARKEVFITLFPLISLTNITTIPDLVIFGLWTGFFLSVI